MQESSKRFLRPSHLALLPSGLWAIDEFQPVAAVLDPETGELIRVVAWADVPAPEQRNALSSLPTVKSDGTGLWVQYDSHGPLVHIDQRGISVAVWVNGLELMGCGPGVAWCRAIPRGGSPTREGSSWNDGDQLLRVDRYGHTSLLDITARITRTKSLREGLFVQLTTTPEDYGIEPTDRELSTCLMLPWNSGTQTASSTTEWRMQVSNEPDWDASGYLPWDGAGTQHFSVHELPPLPSDMTTANHRWVVGSDAKARRTRQDRYPIMASAHTLTGAEVCRWDVGRGMIRMTTSLRDRLGVTIRRPGGASEAVALNPETGEMVVLLAPDAVDISQLVWPMVQRPLHTDSYEAHVRANFGQLSFGEGRLSNICTAIVGEWPGSQIEWTFNCVDRPGLTLRRRVSLFDELGRIDYPDLAPIYLMETIEGGGIPPAEDAIDGYLDL